jgi:hypothetical protein
VKDTYVDGKKLVRNGRKTAIWAGGLGAVTNDGDPLVSSIVASLDP